MAMDKMKKGSGTNKLNTGTSGGKMVEKYDSTSDLGTGQAKKPVGPNKGRTL